jgi:NADH-quinone oxidoreductase subunit H
LFFIGEYANIILMSFLTSLLFFGGWFFPYLPVDSSVSFLVLVFKSVLVVFFFVWVRATYPRYRYDQLMDLGWKSFLPLSLGWVIFIPSFFISLDTFLS